MWPWHFPEYWQSSGGSMSLGTQMQPGRWESRLLHLQPSLPAQHSAVQNPSFLYSERISGAGVEVTSETPDVPLNILSIRELTSRSANCGGGPSVGGNEEGLDKGAKRINDVAEYLGGVLLHVIRLTEGAEKGSMKEWEEGRRERTATEKTLQASLLYPAYRKRFGCTHSRCTDSMATARSHAGFSPSRNLTSRDKKISHSVTCQIPCTHTKTKACTWM